MSEEADLGFLIFHFIFLFIFDFVEQRGGITDDFCATESQ